MRRRLLVWKLRDARSGSLTTTMRREQMDRSVNPRNPVRTSGCPLSEAYSSPFSSRFRRTTLNCVPEDKFMQAVQDASICVELLNRPGSRAHRQISQA